MNLKTTAILSTIELNSCSCTVERPDPALIELENLQPFPDKGTCLVHLSEANFKMLRDRISPLLGTKASQAGFSQIEFFATELIQNAWNYRLQGKNQTDNNISIKWNFVAEQPYLKISTTPATFNNIGKNINKEIDQIERDENSSAGICYKGLVKYANQVEGEWQLVDDKKLTITLTESSEDILESDPNAQEFNQVNTLNGVRIEDLSEYIGQAAHRFTVTVHLPASKY